MEMDPISISRPFRLSDINCLAFLWKKKLSTRSTFKLQCRTVSTKLDGVRDEKHFLCLRIFVCFRNAGFYVFTPRYVMVAKTSRACMCTVWVCVRVGKGRMETIRQIFRVFARWAVCAMCRAALWIHPHTRLGDNPLVWSACLHMAIVHFSTPSWSSQFHSHYALAAQSIQRVSEWVKLKAFSHKSCRGDDSSHMPARSFMRRSHHKN